MTLDNPLILVGLLVLGTVVGYFVREFSASKSAQSVEAKAKAEYEEARIHARELILEAKDRAAALLEEATKQQREEKTQIANLETRLLKREEGLERQMKEVLTKEMHLGEEITQVNLNKSQVVELQTKIKTEFERVAGMSTVEARGFLLKRTEEDYAKDLAQSIQKLEQSRRDEIEKKSLDIILI